MVIENLIEILEKHKKWLKNEKDGERADLSGADLRWANFKEANLAWADPIWADLSGANFRRADLRWADLRLVDLSGADLRGANLDYSCWPLWCGSLCAIVDDRILRQLLYHVLSIAKVSEISEELRDALFTEELIGEANKFHRAEECGKINFDTKSEGHRAK